jgi:predicted RNase H-like HicB family nuclease
MAAARRHLTPRATVAACDVARLGSMNRLHRTKLGYRPRWGRCRGCRSRVKLTSTGPAHMKLGDYKTVLYRQEDGSWVAEIPSIPGCYALMDSRESALSELSKVFEMISAEYRSN